MAVRRKKGSILPAEVSPNPRESSASQGFEADELSTDVQYLLASLGENVSGVTVYREDDNKPGKWDYLTRMTADEFTQTGLETLKTNWGGGSYKLVVIDVSKGPLNPIYTSIDPRFKGKMFAPVVHNGTPLGAPQEDRFRDRILEALLSRAFAPAPAIDPLEIARLFREGSNPKESVAEIIKVALELSERMNPAPVSDGVASAISAFGPVLADLLTKANRVPGSVSGPPDGTPLPARLPARVPEPLIPRPAQIQPPMQPHWLTPFMRLAPMLAQAADDDSDPVLYAEFALERARLSVELMGKIMESVIKNRLEDELLAQMPILKETPARIAFVKEFVEAIKNTLNELEQEEETEHGPEHIPASDGNAATAATGVSETAPSEPPKKRRSSSKL